MTYASVRGISNGGSRERRIGALAARQHGVISRRQLRELGVSDSSIEKAASAGRLHPWTRGVFAVGHPGVGRLGRMLAAVLACGEETVVSHGSAAALLGLRDSGPVVVDVIAPGEAGRAIDGVRPHDVPRPAASEIVLREGIPCTSPSRTLVDLAGSLGERSLSNAVERAAVLGTLDAVAVERCLSRARRRGAPALRSMLGPWRGPATGRGGRGRLRSELEARLLALIAGAGLPAPACNRVVAAEGSRLEVDFLWPRQRLVVEADGRRYHDHRAAFERDRRRDRQLQAAGYRVMRVTATQIATEPGAILAAIGRLLGVR